jgi:hypothetical protein
MNFKYRIEKRSYVVVQDKKTKLYQVVTQMGRRKNSFTAPPENYKQMNYGQIAKIRSEYNPLSHWEEIIGLFSPVNGELLRFMLEYQIPIERIIHYELASRGHDKNQLWVGFEKAKAIWLVNADEEK